MNRMPYVLTAYFLLLLMIAPITLLSFDTYYYWDWSRHLAWSYYDGPPMIAWFIRVFTWFFGDTLLALTMLGIVCQGVAAFFFYRTLRLVLNRDASLAALALWLFAPLVTMDLLKQTTYDTPMTLFWILSLYFVCRYLKFNQNRDLYGIGIACGLMLLSKYSGVVLLLSYFVFLLISPWRRLFFNKHFYGGLFLTCLLFMPVLIWNYQHEWQSFLYQMSVHDLHGKEAGNRFYNIMKSVWVVFIPALNFMLIPPLVMLFQKKKYSDTLRPFIVLHLTICTVFLLFYLYTAGKAEIREYWLTPYIISSAFLAGFCYQQTGFKHIIPACIALYVVSSAALMINTTLWFHATVPKKLVYYNLMQQFNADHPNLPETIFTAGWSEARLGFFLKNQPDIYTLGCGSRANQYKLWSQDVMRKLERRQIKEALFIDMHDRSTCAKKYFDVCEPLEVSNGRYPEKNFRLYAWHCSII